MCGLFPSLTVYDDDDIREWCVNASFSFAMKVSEWYVVCAFVFGMNLLVERVCTGVPLQGRSCLLLLQLLQAWKLFCFLPLTSTWRKSCRWSICRHTHVEHRSLLLFLSWRPAFYLFFLPLHSWASEDKVSTQKCHPKDTKPRVSTE